MKTFGDLIIGDTVWVRNKMYGRFSKATVIGIQGGPDIYVNREDLIVLELRIQGRNITPYVCVNKMEASEINPDSVSVFTCPESLQEYIETTVPVLLRRYQNPLIPETDRLWAIEESSKLLDALDLLQEDEL